MFGVLFVAVVCGCPYIRNDLMMVLRSRLFPRVSGFVRVLCGSFNNFGFCAERTLAFFRYRVSGRADRFCSRRFFGEVGP